MAAVGDGGSSDGDRPRDREDPRAAASRRRLLGGAAEAAVADRLRASGFEIVAANARVGRDEIDLIARNGNLLVFCEVRARSAGGFVHPAETIDAAKVARIRRAAARWLREHPVGAVNVRFDAAAVVAFGRDAALQIEYYEDAF